MAEDSQIPKGQPYVKYLVTADVVDKGICFTISRSIKTFLSNHGFDANIKQVVATSDRYEGIITFYDNGKYDFNAVALDKHLQISGKLPSQEDVRPKVKIQAIPFDFDSENLNVRVVNTKNDEAWIKTCDGLTARIDELMKEKETLENGQLPLIKTLSDSQKELDKVRKEKKELESILQGSKPESFASASKAVVESYLKGQAEILEGYLPEVANDMERLAQLGLQDSELELSKIDYINRRIEVNFSDEEAVNSALEKLSYDSFEETPEAKEFQELQAQYQRDNAIYEQIKTQGLSKGVLDVVYSTLREKNVELEAKKNILEENQSRFDADRSIAEKVSDAVSEYVAISDVIVRANERKEFELEMPIFIAQTNDELNVYIPDSKNEQHPINKYIQKTLFSSSPISNEKYDSGLCSFTVKSDGEFNFQPNQDGINQKLFLLKNLGLGVKVVYLKE